MKLCRRETHWMVRRGRRRISHAPSRAAHAPARGDCLKGDFWRVEARASPGWLLECRSGDGEPSGGVAGRKGQSSKNVAGECHQRCKDLTATEDAGAFWDDGLPILRT